MKKNRKELALKTMQGLVTLTMLFHLAIITQLIPYTIVWAGKLKSPEEMRWFEAVSLLILTVLQTVLFLKSKSIKTSKPSPILNIILWFYIVVFSLNTLGNLSAETLFEKLVFTPLTLLSTILLWLVVKKDKMMS